MVGSLLFLVYTNYTVVEVDTDITLFAYGPSHNKISCIIDPAAASLNGDMHKISNRDWRQNELKALHIEKKRTDGKREKARKNSTKNIREPVDKVISYDLSVNIQKKFLEKDHDSCQQDV
ncbi:hypothetical protein CHS0354_015928 [Potamilus streckersoni]|uniref:Uncharacterized protein n=1 Tax=Potamilus streckersoni TaxID=2493646 RepID=A0AAE0SRF4_9BIVA|nr:hypothetical protein CHS0354_015928 [Potamilus streckersoni]